MIKGFEKETQRLSPEEELLVQPIIEILKNCVGKTRSIKNFEIAEKIVSSGIVEKLPGARIRKIIHHIRVNKKMNGILATSNGYYISINRAEIHDYIESLKQREQAIKDVRDIMADYYQNLYLQKSLFGTDR